MFAELLSVNLFDYNLILSWWLIGGFDFWINKLAVGLSVMSELRFSLICLDVVYVSAVWSS